ncbi:pyridoxal phosphate-dependent aminotransferase [Candidatus Bathyarchaeota archaeon]|nr:pyridoxal phosphate-dependent aminotransferase [Candidatus Bathyarchaeota archaeon]
MKHPSAYLDWYIHVPKVKYDFRSSGLGFFKYDLMLGEVDLSVNYANGNPEATKLLAKRYSVKPENVFISSEGTSGQNVRLLRYLAEKSKKKEAIVEYPTYEPFLRQVQEYFPEVKRLERKENDAYRLDSTALRKLVSNKTGLFALTNPHAPSGATSNANELKEILTVARENDVHVLCDEIYAEFNRKTIPTVFSIDDELGIVTTSFTKAYGLGGLRFSVALAKEDLVKELYNDTLNTIGNSSNIVQLIAIELLTRGREKLEEHKRKWIRFKNETERWLNKNDFEYFPNKAGITYWIKMPTKETYQWINDHTIPKYSLAPVPGAFFLFKKGYKLVRTDKIRLGLGNINPDNPNLSEALGVLGKAVTSYKQP